MFSAKVEIMLQQQQQQQKSSKIEELCVSF